MNTFPKKMKKSDRISQYENDLEFCERHFEEMLSFMGKCWGQSNQFIYSFIMDWTIECGWSFTEGLLSYYLQYGTFKDYFIELKEKYNGRN